MHASVTRRELLIFMGVLVAAITLLPVLGGVTLWTRPFWMDELATYWVTSHPSPVEVIGHIARGGEWSPPVFHLVVWAVRAVTGDLTPVMLRTISLGFVATALLFVYATLRRRCGVSASVTGILVIAAHSLIIEHAFEGRMYSAWLACAAGYAWALGINSASSSARRDMGQALFAVLLVGVHWFGILSLGLMATGAILARPVSWRHRARFILPSTAAVLALAASMPLLLAQRSAATGLQWIPDITFAQTTALVRLLFPRAVVVVLAVLLIAYFVRPTAPARVEDAASLRLDSGIAALATLLLVPLVLAVVSIVVQPSMLPRYAIVTLLGWAPLVALGTNLLGSLGRGIMIAFLGLLLADGMRTTIVEKREFVASVLENRAALEAARPSRLPLVFQALLPMYPATALDQSSHPRYIAVSDSTIGALYQGERLEYLRQRRRVEREIGREHLRLFHFPAIVAESELDTTSRFILVAEDASLPEGYQDARLWGGVVFPNHRVTRLTSHLALFERSHSPSRSTRASPPVTP